MTAAVSLDVAVALLEELSEGLDVDGLDVVASTASACGVDVNDLWDRLFRWDAELIVDRAVLASLPSMGRVRADQLLDSYQTHVLWHVAINPAASPAKIGRCLRSWERKWDYLYLVPRLCLNPSMTQRSLRSRSTSPIDETRRAVAANVSTPAGVLRTLSLDRDTKTRAAVAINPATDAGTLSILSTDPEAPIRHLTVAHPNAPMTLVAGLVDDPTTHVHGAAKARLHEMASAAVA